MSASPYAVVILGSDGRLQFGSASMSYVDCERLLAELGNPAARVVSADEALRLKALSVNHPGAMPTAGRRP